MKRFWYVLAKSHMRAERGTAWLRAVVQPGLNGAPPGRAQLCSTVCLRFCQPFLLQPELSFLILNSASLVTKLFSSMGINRPVDKLIVQKVFEMIKAVRMSEAKATGRNVNKPCCTTVLNQAVPRSARM